MNTGGRRVDELHAEIARHAQQLSAGQEDPTQLVRWIARVTGYSERHVWRCVHHLRSGIPLPGRGRFELTPLQVETIGIARGNVEGARKRLILLGEEVPSESTFRRAAKEQLGGKQLAAFKTGAKGIRDTTVYLEATDYPRGVRWQMDNTHLPVRVRDDKTNEVAKKVWLTTVLDTGTRYLLGWTLTVGHPDAESVRQAMLMGFYGERIDGGERIGGVPDLVVWDRGTDFLSELVEETCIAFRTLGIALPPRRPELKGRVERFYRSLKEELIDFLPAHTRGPTDLAGNLYNEGEVIKLSALQADLEDWLDRYNHDRPHGGLDGRTPLRAWQEDPYHLIRPPRHAIYDAMSRGTKSQGVHGNGVKFRNRWYKPMSAKSLRTSKVDIRFNPKNLDAIELFDPDSGRHLCEAVWGKVMGPKDRHEHLELRRKDDHNVNTVRRTTTQRKRQRFEKSGHLVVTPSDTPTQTLTAAGKDALDQLTGAAFGAETPPMPPHEPTGHPSEQMELL